MIPGKLRTAHRASAMVVGLFLVMHIANHLIGLIGPAAHVRAMTVLRFVYRNPVVEPVLLALLAWQIMTGATLIVRGWKGRSGTVAWLQAISGFYLLIFLALHVTAVISARIADIDTNIFFAAAGFHIPGWPWFFTPYYSLAVFALFTHIGAAVYWNIADSPRRKLILGTFVGFGVVVAAAITGSMITLTMPPDTGGSISPLIKAR